VRVLAAAAAAVAVGGLSSSAADTAARAIDDRIILTSNRTGAIRGYSIRADGSRLTPLLGPRSQLSPVAVSGDGSTIAYVSAWLRPPAGIYLSHASGARLRRVAAAPASDPALSRDGGLVAFTTRKRGIWIVGTDGRGARRLTAGPDGLPEWSPDGKAVVFFRLIGESAGALVVQPLHGTRRVVARTLGTVAKWSPDGRWIAYKNEDELWLVRPSGARRHRVARQAGSFDWAPDGRRLAFSYGGQVAIVGVDGRGRRLRPRVYVSELRWSPDGRRLALHADASEIWTIGVDGRGLRRLTKEGSNRLLGWTRLAPVRAPARPIPRTEQVVGPDALTTRAAITDIAADGARVAFSVRTTATDCRHVAVWIPDRHSVRRLPDRPEPCGDLGIRDHLGSVTLAGTRAAWIRTGGGNTQEESVVTATLARPETVGLLAGSSINISGTFVTGLAGEGSLVAFSVEQRCDRTDPDDRTCPRDRSDNVVATTVYRLGGAGPCPFDSRVPPACTHVAMESGPLAVLAVDAARIAVRTAAGIRLLSQTGAVLRNLPLKADVAVLSGDRLAVRTPTAVDVYDVATGRLTARVPVPQRATLEDLDGDVLVTASASMVTLRRLGDGRTATFEVTGRARAELEPPGLFVAGDRRLTFVPIAEVVRRLDG
jgi:Tol biopolymer transport system component